MAAKAIAHLMIIVVIKKGLCAAKERPEGRKWINKPNSILIALKDA